VYVTRQPDYSQADQTNTAAKRLVQLIDQLEGIFPELGPSRVSVLYLP